MTGDLTPTAEQQAVLEAASSGESIAISAAAGSGKTSTLRMIASARPHTRMAVQLEADGSFPSNVTWQDGAPIQYARALVRSSVVTGPEQSFSETAQASMASHGLALLPVGGHQNRQSALCPAGGPL